MGHRVEMSMKPKYCLTCEFWDGEREAYKDLGYMVAECPSRYTAGKCKSNTSYRSRTEAKEYCKSFQYWKELGC